MRPLVEEAAINGTRVIAIDPEQVPGDRNGVRDTPGKFFSDRRPLALSSLTGGVGPRTVKIAKISSFSVGIEPPPTKAA